MKAQVPPIGQDCGETDSGIHLSHIAAACLIYAHVSATFPFRAIPRSPLHVDESLSIWGAMLMSPHIARE